MTYWEQSTETSCRKSPLKRGKGVKGRTTLRTPCHKFLATPLSDTVRALSTDRHNVTPQTVDCSLSAISPRTCVSTVDVVTSLGATFTAAICSLPVPMYANLEQNVRSSATELRYSCSVRVCACASHVQRKRCTANATSKVH